MIVDWNFLSLDQASSELPKRPSLPLKKPEVAHVVIISYVTISDSLRKLILPPGSTHDGVFVRTIHSDHSVVRHHLR